MPRSILSTLSELIAALDRAVRTLPPREVQACLEDLVQRVGAALERTSGREAPTRHQTEDHPPPGR